jgi:hypothetical protein
MEKEFKEMLMKRMQEQGKVDPKKLEAKASMMKELSDMLGTDMKDSISKGMNKVTVASDSPEGLETGLDLAKKKLNAEENSEDMPEMEESDEENYSDDMPESDDAELAELEKKIAELKAKKLK